MVKDLQMLAYFLQFVDAEGHSRPLVIPILFLGDWDTVTTLLDIQSRVGRKRIKKKKTDEEIISHPPIAKLPNIVYNAYQALALHEMRAVFPPNLWLAKEPWQTVEQTWFAGAHADVGGGLQNRDLSDIALVWMVERAKVHKLEFNESRLNEIGPRNGPASVPRFFQPISDSFTNSGYVCLGKSIRQPGTEGIEETVHLSVLARSSFDIRPKYEACFDDYEKIDRKSLDIDVQLKGGDLEWIVSEIDRYKGVLEERQIKYSNSLKPRLERKLKERRQR